MKLIQSRDNPTFKHLRALVEESRYRREQGRTVLDGAHLIKAASAAGVVFHRVVVTAKAMRQQEVQRIVEGGLPSRCELLEVSETLLRQISPVDTPAGIAAEIEIPRHSPVNVCGDVLMLEAVQDAGNLGTLLRTAAAAGVGRVVLSAQCAQAWSPKVLRAGMGGHFALHITEGADLTGELSTWQGPVLATALTIDAVDLYATDLRAPAVWLFGSEGQGLSAAMLQRATQRVRIPMPGGTESLNVAAAAAVCLFEQLRQRRI
ncbi:RNA methyltransferase [Viridibacterium curvum]|uniref:RNA methyltransferase n=1 Tax=Viridibacterium curvum TaxID=1101404 RepID=A0ABP9QB37_9RHOO